MLVRRSQFASLSTAIMLNSHDFCTFWVLTKPGISKFACDVSSSSERTTICWHWIIFDYCPQSSAGPDNLVYNKNHVVDLEIIRTDVGQTFPICFTMLNIQHFCIFWVLTKPDVFQTLPICLNVRHNVQYSLQFPNFLDTSSYHMMFRRGLYSFLFFSMSWTSSIIKDLIFWRYTKLMKVSQAPISEPTYGKS